MKTLTYRLFHVFSLLVACSDDTTAADGSGSTSSSTSGSDASAAPASSSDEVTGSTDLTSSTVTADASTSIGGESSSASTGIGSTGSTGEGSSTGGASTSESGDETGGVSTVCEDGGELVLQWGVQVPGGVYPDDIPTDLVETCAYTPAPGALTLDCPSVDLVVTVESTPVVDLPSDAGNAAVRLHRAIGPLGFPDFWMAIDFDGERNFSLVSSSVFVPPNPTVELPHGMSLSEDECGPFNIGTPFEPEDPCGDQMWLGVDLELDVPTTVFHGTYADGTIDGDDVGVWVGTARDYGTLPQFCDFAASFFTTMVVTG